MSKYAKGARALIGHARIGKECLNICSYVVI